MTDFTTAPRELTLQEMLADPIVQTMMARAGVTRQDVEGLIETVRDRMAFRQMAERGTRRHESSPNAFEAMTRQQRIPKLEERRPPWKR